MGPSLQQWMRRAIHNKIGRRRNWPSPLGQQVGRFGKSKLKHANRQVRH